MAKMAKEAKERKLKPSEDKQQICKDLCSTLAQTKRFGDLIAIGLMRAKEKKILTESNSRSKEANFDSITVKSAMDLNW